MSYNSLLLEVFELYKNMVFTRSSTYVVGKFQIFVVLE